jgi:hypothetical protein
MLVAMSAMKVWACLGSNAAGSRFPLQVRTRRSSSLAGFPLQSLTRKCKLIVTMVTLCLIAGMVRGQSVSIAADPIVEARVNLQTGNEHHATIKRIDRKAVPWDSNDVAMLTWDTLPLWLPELKWLVDSVMTQEDLDSMIAWIWQYQAGNWAGSSLAGARLIEPKPMMKIKRNDDYWAFSEPLYFNARRRCLLKEEYQCGFMCAQSEWVLYELGRDGQWHFVRTIWALAD